MEPGEVSYPKACRPTKIGEFLAFILFDFPMEIYSKDGRWDGCGRIRVENMISPVQ